MSRRVFGAIGRSGAWAHALSVRWVVGFAALLLIVSAVPVLAAELPMPSEELTLPPTPEDFDPSRLPGAEDVTAAIEKAEREEEDREAWLESPEAIQEREESRFAFSGLNHTAIQELLSTAFAEQMAQLNADPARVLSDARLLSSSEESSAAIEDEGNNLLLESSMPVQTEDEAGDLRKVDLSLEETVGGYETENALVEVQIPESAEEPIEVGEEGVSIQLAGAEDQVALPFGDENVLASEVLPDTDMLVSPITTGVEIFNLLRSEHSPETLRFQVGLPAGAELRADGEWGAEIVKEGELLTIIPEPIAVDAQGTDVPVDLQVEGDSLLLTVDHREGDYAMPILLDPQVLENNENWIYGQNHNALDMGVWAYNNNGSSWFRGSTYCIYECFGPGGAGTRGLYVSLEGQRSYGASQFGQWSYSAPNTNSYISSVTLGAPYVHADHNCSEAEYPQPHNYFGVWSASQNKWAYVSVNSANQPGGTYTLPYAGDAVIFGLGTGGGIPWIPCWRDLYAGGAHIWLDDWSQPTLTTSSSGQWMDASPVRLNVRASDPGLGVRKFEAEAVNKSGVMQKWETWHSCDGTRRFPCPQTWNLAEASQPQLAYAPSALPEGIRTLNVTAFDATLRKSAMSNGMTVRIDHAPPEIKLSGTITEQGTLGTERPIYIARVEAKDGEPKDDEEVTNDLTKDRSGVVSISEWIDDKKVNEYAPGCLTQNCQQFDEGFIEAAAYSKGKHTLTVKATDALGHVASQQLAIALGDTQAPSLNVGGLPVESSTMPTKAVYWKTFGVNGSGDGQLKSPADVAIDAQGDLWVVDKGNNRIQKFSSSGRFLLKFGSLGSGNGQLSSPAAIAIDPKGNIWVADKGNGRVQKFNPKGEYLTQFGSKGIANGQFTSGGPESLAIDPKGNIWVSDTYAGRLQKFDENGAFLKVVSSKGSAPGQLGEPTGIDIGPNGKVWVTDWQNNRVTVFNEAGEYLTQFGSAGAGAGQFSRPDAIAIGSRGDVWVGDQNNGRIQEFDQNGTYLGQFGSKGSGPGQFNFAYPMGVATDSKGSVWIADTNNHRIQRWLVPNTTVSGYLEPLSATATDGGYGVTSVAVKLTDAAGSTEVLGQTSKSCTAGACPLNFNLEELDLSGKPSGTYLLSVVATDGAGNVREVSRVLSLDSTPPELELAGSLVESAGQPLNALSAQLDIAASDSDPASGGVNQINVERDGRLVASYPSNCSSDCHEVGASYTYRTAPDGADRSIKPVAASGNGSIGELRRLSCVTAKDCWAVGRTKYTISEQTEGKVPEPLLERWNGSEWQMTAIPKPEGATSVSLEGVSCAAANACLAVGTYSNGTSQPLAEYWNGSKWTAGAVPLPAGATKGALYGVSCSLVGNCWAYGKTQVTIAEQSEGKFAVSFFARWNGAQWQTSTVPKPEGATSVSLEDISCAAASACLAVGSYNNGANRPLAEYWDGSKWTAGSVPLPAGSAKGSLSDISCGSAGDCWANGLTQITIAEQGEGKAAIPFFSHWSGGGWQTEATAKAPDGSPTSVTSLSCDSPTACTAVGRYTNPQGETLPLAYTWDPAGWRFQPMPIKSEATTSSLEGVSCTEPNECAMVGYSRVGTGQWQVLAEAEVPNGGPHEITVEAVDVQGNAASETIEIDVAPEAAQPPECHPEVASVSPKGILSAGQAISAIEEALPAAVAPSEAAIESPTEEEIDPSYSPPSPNLEAVDSLAESEASVTPGGGFTLANAVCFTPTMLTTAATAATVANGDAAVFANTAPETDTMIRPTAMGAMVMQALRGPNAPNSFAWNVTVAPGEEVIELPSGDIAIVDATSSVPGGTVELPAVPAKSPQDLADAEIQLGKSEYQLAKASNETSYEVLAVIARPWVVLAQGGIVPALIEVAPDTETPNEFEVWVSLPDTQEEEAELIMEATASSARNGHCLPGQSPCGQFDADRAAEYAKYWGNEAHQGGHNWNYPDYGGNNCTNFMSQIIRKGGMHYIRAYDDVDGAWWYRCYYHNCGLWWNGHDETTTWTVADMLPRHLWRFGLVHIDPVNQPYGWTKGDILAYDWFGQDGKGNFDHLQFVVGTIDPSGRPREPLIANSSSPGHRYGSLEWLYVKKRIEAAQGNDWTRVPLAVRHTHANWKEKQHAPQNLYSTGGVFQG